jgi:hypothetical protein
MALKGKWKHSDDIHEKLHIERSRLLAVDDELDKWKRLEFPEVDLPSRHEEDTKP